MSTNINWVLGRLDDILCSLAELIQNQGTVTIDELDIGSVDVNATGFAPVTRCTPDCGTVTLVVCKDENAAAASIDVSVVGWFDEAGTYTAGPYSGLLEDCAGCPQTVEITSELLADCITTPGTGGTGGGGTDNGDGTVTTTPVALESQPTAGSAGLNPPLNWIGGLPASLDQCLNEPVVDTLINPAVPAGATQFTLNWETLDVGQDRAAVQAYDTATGALLPLIGSSDAFGSYAATGPLGPNFATFDVSGVADPSTVAVVFAVVGGTINDPDPGLCDTYELVSTISDAPADPDPGGETSGSSLSTVGCLDQAILDKLCEIAGNTMPPPAVSCQVDWITICDNLPDGSSAQFYRAIQICYDNGVEISRAVLGDFQADLTTPYTLAGVEGQCDPTTIDTDESPFCDQGAGTDGTPFIRYVTVVNGQPVVVVETEVDGITPYTPVGPIVPGFCTTSPPVTIDNTCDNPVPVASCPDNPLEVVLVNDFRRVDVEWVCNTATGFFQEITTVSNGDVVESVSTVDTTINCVADGVDYEQPVECRSGTRWVVLNQITADGTVTELAATDTSEPCTVDIEYVCNESTGFYDQLTTVVVDGVTSAPVSTPTTVSCAPTVPPVVTVDVEFVCNPVSNLLDQITVTTTDGVAGDPVMTPTLFNCDTPPVVTVDTEFVCNDTTELLDQITVTTTDGVAGPPTVTATTIPCVGQPPDIEMVRECRNETQWVVTYSTEPDGTQTEIAAVDTTELCVEPQTECVKWSSIVVQLDNTGTRYTESHTIEFTNSDGTTTQITAGPFTSWSDQITGWAAAMDAAYAGSYDPRCTILPNGCGGLLPPPADAPAAAGIFARYVNGVHCPTDLAIPVEATVLASSNPKRVGHKLPFAIIETPEQRGYRCLTCTGGVTGLFFDDGTPVPEADLPVCTFACAEGVPSPPLTACDFTTIQGCDQTPAGVVPIIVVYTNCGDEIPTPSYYQDDGDGGLVDYNNGDGLIGEFLLDCATGEVIPEPEPEPCPEPSVIACADPCANVSTFINGRPPAGAPWSWGPYAGPDLAAFEAVLAAAGYTLIQFGEKHSICPPFGAFGEDPDAPLTNSVGTSQPVVEPNYDPNYVSDESCALQTAGCNDDRRDDLLAQIPVGDSECVTGPGQGVTYTNTDNTTELDISVSGAGDIIKITGGSGDGSDQEITDYISACLADGGTVDITWEMVGGGTGSGTITGQDAPFPGFSGPGTFEWGGVAGDPGQAGKLTTLTAVCGIVAEPRQVLFVEDVCVSDKLDTLIDLISTLVDQNAQLVEQNAQLIGCVCCPDDACVDSCAWGAGGVAVDNVWQPSEGGLTWTICGEQYVTPAGSYSNTEMAGWVTDNTPHTATVVPDPEDPAVVIFYLSIPCDCEAPSFQFGDDPPVVVAAIPQFDVTCADTAGLGEPIGDQTICTTSKMGADFTSAATGEATHTAGSLYLGTGPVTAWIGTFTVTDSAGGTHVFNDGDTVTGLASGSAASVTFTGEVEYTLNDVLYRCPVTDKAISAGFVVL